MKELKDIIRKDYFRYYGVRHVGFLSKLRLYGWHYTRIWRKAHYYKMNNRIMYLFYGSLLMRLTTKYGFQIGVDASIGPGLYIGHFGSVIVNEHAVIGKNCNLAPGVVIGQQNRGEKKGAPVIGDQVWIGCNAVVVGNIKIGNNVLIAPGAYVNFDVQDNSIVIGNPGTICTAQNAVEHYINNVVE